jgi:hypothetical protein
VVNFSAAHFGEPKLASNELDKEAAAIRRQDRRRRACGEGKQRKANRRLKGVNGRAAE